MTDTFKHPCPECHTEVTARHARSNTGLGVLPFTIQVRRGPEHATTCKHWMSPKDYAAECAIAYDGMGANPRKLR